jgi:hypothetical protein
MFQSKRREGEDAEKDAEKRRQRNDRLSDTEIEIGKLNR